MTIAPAILKHYPDLNAEQRQIVAHVDGPLLVVAGPGSGKTYSIVLRALNLLLLEKATVKEVVLCTFTEKAAFEMRDRLSAAAQRVGYRGDLSELRVTTIHGMCNRILTQHRHRTALGNSYETLDELTQLLFIFEHFDEIIGPAQNDLYLGKWKTRWTAIDGTRGYFDKITEELVDTTQLSASPDPFMQGITRAFLAYEAALFANNRTDFAHLQSIVHSLLQLPEHGDPIAKDIRYMLVDEYLAFMLKLYAAQPVPGLSHLHGKKGKAMIHIGAVDAPVTIAEIDAAVDECAKLKQNELHVLGWEWEMGLYDLMVEASKKKGVKLLLLIIPREVMEQQTAAKGDVRFFELAYLEAAIKQPKKLTAQVVLKDFVIPNTELIPEEVRSKVKKWSDYIDYWSVDWDFQNDTFMQGWAAYRTRKERKLPLTSDSHTYEKTGKHRILVKVIDIFGNDTSQAFDVEVK